MATLNEALSLVDDIAKELSFYDCGTYKQASEQTIISRCKDLLEKVKTSIMAKDPDGVIRADKMSLSDWRRISLLVGPLARCFTASSPPAAPTVKTRHASALAVAALALLSSCNQKSKIIVTSALENGVVDAFVNTLRNSLRNQVTDRVVKAMLYKLIEALWGFTLYASTQLQQDMVAKDVVNVCLDLVTSSTMEIESKLNASKTLYNCLSSHDRVVTELRSSKVLALNQMLQQLASQVPDPVAAAQLVVAGGPNSASKAISMPQMLSSIMSWIWFLPSYIIDHLIDALGHALSRVVVLVWPEGHLDIPLMDPGREEAIAGPLHVAQISLPNRFLQRTLQHLFRAIASGLADMRLVSILRGARLVSVARDPEDSEEGDQTEVEEEVNNTALPARLVKVVREGRPDANETRVALELLDELFACDANGSHPELADDALSAGLLASMTDMGVLHSLHTEAGIAGVSAYVRLTMKLIKRVPYTPGLASRLHGSGVPASVAYVAFWPTSRVSLKLDALQTLYELVQLDTDMTEHVVVMNNFPIALTNTLLGGDPDSRKPPKKSGSTAGGKKKSGGGAAANATASGSSPAVAAEASASNRRDHRDQMQEAAFNILAVVLDEARESDKVWETVVESGMLPRLVQHSCAFPMQPALLAELLLAIGITFKDHREDIVSVGALQAACAPHILPLLIHEEPVVAAAAARVLRDILLDMARYRSDSTDFAEGDDILKALVAAGPAIDTADVAAAQVAAAAAAKAAAAATVVVTAATASKDGEASASPGKSGLAPGLAEGQSPDAPRAVDESQRGSAQGDGMIEVDRGPASSTAPTLRSGTSLAGSGNISPVYAGAVTTSADIPMADLAATAAAAAATATSAIPAAGPESDTPELVDVTAHGLGLICAAMLSCIATVLQRPRMGTPMSPGPGAGRGTTVLPGSTASSPSGKGAGGIPKGQRVAATASAAAPPILLEGPPYEALEALLLSCRLLGEACLHMPPHGTVRKHLARAFAYAKPAAEELATVLQALPNPEHGQLQLLPDCRDVVDVLGKVPVLDVALLPKPKGVEEEDVNLASAPAAPPVPRKGRPPGSGKRFSQANLASDGTAQPTQPLSKRQRTASAAALVAPEEAAPAPIGRTRSSALVAGNGEHAATAKASPRTLAPHGPAAVPAAGIVANGAALTADLALQRQGGSFDGSAPIAGRSRGPRSAGNTGGLGGAGGGVTLARTGSDVQGIPAGTGKAHQRSATPVATQPRGSSASGAGVPLPAIPPAMKTPEYEDARDQEQAAMQPHASQSEPHSMTSLDIRKSSTGPNSASLSSGEPGAGAATAAAAMTLKPEPGAIETASGAVIGGGADGYSGKGTVAEFRRRFLELKAKNGVLTQELEDLRLAKEEMEAQQQKTAASLEGTLKELEANKQELEVLKKELAERKTELQEANLLQLVTNREMEQLRAENADLKAELANLADLE